MDMEKSPAPTANERTEGKSTYNEAHRYIHIHTHSQTPALARELSHIQLRWISGQSKLELK